MPQAKYVLMPKLLTPNVDPGKSIELEIFITGAGPVKENKLFLSYPSVIINKENPGEIILSISAAVDDFTNKIIEPVSGRKVLQTHRCDYAGTTVTLPQGYFLPIPHAKPPSWSLDLVMAESKWDN